MLATKYSHLEVWHYFLSQRVMRPWNRLPYYVVEASTVDTFKRNNAFEYSYIFPTQADQTTQNFHGWSKCTEMNLIQWTAKSHKKSDRSPFVTNCLTYPESVQADVFSNIHDMVLCVVTAWHSG